MFKDARLIWFVPDAQGQGGMKTAVHSHQAQPLLDIYNCYNWYVVNGRWRKSLDPAATGTNEAAQSLTQAVHVFYEYSLTDPTAAPTAQLLAHNYASGSGTNTIWNASTGAVIHQKVAPSLPANFANVKGRCFFAWGSEEGQITDGEISYKIGLDQPGSAALYSLSGGSTYAVWADSASPYVSAVSPSPAWVNAAPPIGDLGRSIVVNGSRFVIDAVTIFTAAAGPGLLTNVAGTYTATINAAWPANLGYGGLSLTVGGDTALISSYTVSGSTTAVTFQTTLPNVHSGVAYTLTGSRITLSANSIASGWAVSAIVYRGSLSWTGAGPKYAYAWVDPVTGHYSNLSPITTVTEDSQANVTVTLTGIDASAEPRAYATRIFRTLLSGGNTPYQLTGGPDQPADLGYIYYAYFTNGSANIQDHGPATGTLTTINGNATVTYATGNAFEDTWIGDTIVIDLVSYTISGHPTSNTLTISPVYAATTGTHAFSVNSKSPYRYLLTDPPSGGTKGIDYSTYGGLAVHVQGSTATVTAFTIASGNTLGITLSGTWGGTSGYYYFTIATVPGSLTFVDTYADSYLNTLIPGPIDTNGDPEIDGDNAYPAHLAYWDARIWINPTQAPSFLIYSADAQQAPIGVPEESFPSNNVLTIPAADGRVVGMKVIGPFLIITTERFAYYVAGNNETNYRLVRFATTMYGVGDYQMDELTADTGESANVVYLGRDKKLYVLSPGSGAISLTEPVADQLTNNISTMANYQACRVHVAHVEQRRLVILRMPSQCLVYDIERKVWTQLTPGGIIPDAFATLYGGSRPVTELYGYAGSLFSWLREDVSTANSIATLSTFSTGFTDTKGKKRLHEIRLIVSADTNDVSKPWYVEIAVDDKTGASDIFTLPILPYTATVNSYVNAGDIYTIYPTGAVPVDGANCKELIGYTSNATSTTYPSPGLAAPMEGFRFYITVHGPETTAPRDLLAFGVIVQEIQDPKDVQP